MKKHIVCVRLVFVISLLIILGIGRPAQAAVSDLTWNKTGENGNWANTGHWDGPSGQTPNEPDERAIFNSPVGMGMPIQNSAMSNGLGSLVFNSSGWTVYVSDNFKFTSQTYYSYNAISSSGTGENIIYPAIEFLNARQNIHTGSGSTLVIANGGFIGSYAPVISSYDPTSVDTGAVRVDVASAVSDAFYVRQGTLLVRHSSALGTSTSIVNIGGDEYVTDGGYAKFLTDAASVNVPKPLRVRSFSHEGHTHNVQARLGSNNTTGSNAFLNPVTLDLSATLVAAGSSIVSFAGQISGAGGITKDGSGVVVLGNTNTYAGATDVIAGTLRMGTAGALPATTDVTLADSAGTILDLSGHLQSINSLSGGGAGGGAVTLGAAQFTIRGGNFAGTISGTNGWLIKTSSGTLALSGTSSYTGPTAVAQGTLLVNGQHNGGGTYTVSSSATLGGEGSIYAPVNVQGGGFLSPGSYIESLNIYGDADIAGTLKVEANGTTGQIDLLVVGGDLDISSATVDFDVSGTLTAPAYVFAAYNSLTGGHFASVTDLPDGYTIDYNYQNNKQIALVIPPPPQPVYGKIAWQSGSDPCNFDIEMMNLDGTGGVNLSFVGDPMNLYSDTDPHFKPDGAKILFVSQNRPDPGGPSVLKRIYEMYPDGTDVTALSPGGPTVLYNAIEPKYSWDGTRVVFRKAKAILAGEDILALFQVEDPAGTIKNIPNTDANDHWPSFSPDGKWVVFQRNFKSATAMICRIRPDGSELVQLTDGSHLDEMPAYSPDGLYIIFKRGGTHTENPDIYVMLAEDGSGLTNLTETLSDMENAPTWSLEGAKIAFESATAGPATSEICIADPNGSNRLQLTNNILIDLHPTFSPFNQCDFDKDGDVDLLDFAILASAWRTTVGQPAWLDKCDVSIPKDDVIDWLDVRVFCDNWLKGK